MKEEWCYVFVWTLKDMSLWRHEFCVQSVNHSFDNETSQATIFTTLSARVNATSAIVLTCLIRARVRLRVWLFCQYLPTACSKYCTSLDSKRQILNLPARPLLSRCLVVQTVSQLQNVPSEQNLQTGRSCAWHFCRSCSGSPVALAGPRSA